MLAADFLRAGLADSDTPVLNRLMGLLTAPLATLAGERVTEDTQYAEWVGMRARVAVLEAHARCAVHAGSCEDAETRETVRRAQRPFLRCGCMGVCRQHLQYKLILNT